MRTKFIDSVKQAFKDNGYGSIGSSSEEDTGGIFIVGVEGRIFTVDEDFHVGENVFNFMAEGSGGQVALGALYATKNQKNPKLRLKAALEAASEFNMAVAPPFTYIQV
jgi:ATP-dependent protease HslVU (ClpYQ) peptidase subunit